jgi:hypothetical protein
MGTISGPFSIPDGLVFYLDAANSTSYSGSGNTFYNLINASIGGSIVGYASTPIDNTQIKSLTFDGSNDFISVGSLGSFYTQGTISFWMKSLDITANYRNPFSTNYNGSLNVNVLRFEQGEGAGALKCWFGDPSNNIASLSYSSISANTWYNVVVTWNQSTTTVTGYLNGVLDVNNSSWVRWPTSFVNVGIGLGYNSRYFLGNIGQVSIYNRALSASEIFQNYNASKKRYFPEENIVTNGLVLHIDPSKPSSYTGSGNTVYDLSGSGNTGTLANGAAFSGLNGGVIVFDGTNDYMTIPHNSSQELTYITVSAWFNFPVIPVAGLGINKEGSFRLISGESYTTTAGGRIGGSWGTGVGAGSTTLISNKWYQIVMTADGTTQKLYVNGSLDYTTNNPALATINTNVISFATYHYGAGYFLNCKMTKIQLYNRALSAVEVQQNYNATKGRFGY